jgi:hypothetical protein
MRYFRVMLCFWYSVWVRKYLLWSPYGGKHNFSAEIKKLYFLAPAVLSALRGSGWCWPSLTDYWPNLLACLLILKKVCGGHAKRTAGAYLGLCWSVSLRCYHRAGREGPQLRDARLTRSPPFLMELEMRIRCVLGSQVWPRRAGRCPGEAALAL